MSTTAKAILTLSCIAFSISCGKGSLSNDGSQSRLSSVRLDKFEPEGGLPWKSGQLSFKRLGEAEPSIRRSFTAAQSVLDAQIPYGTYEISLDYYEDERSSKLLYKACLDKDNKAYTRGIFQPTVALEIEICDAAGSAIGTTSGTSNVTVKPVARTSGSSPSPSSGPTPTTSSTPAPTPTPTPAPTQQTTVMGDAAKGAQLLSGSCAFCHGGSGAGPVLDKSRANEMAFERALMVSDHNAAILTSIRTNKLDLIAALALR